MSAGALPERPPISAPHGHVRVRRQPALGLAGVTLVAPVALALGVGLGTPERSLLVLGPLSTFALAIIATIAFWWDDWPGTVLRAPLSGLADTALLVAGGVLSTLAGQAVCAHADLAGVFDPAARAARAPTFPATMPLAAAIFVAMLELTLVCEGWPLRRLNRFAAGCAALAAAWAAGLAIYEALVRTGAVSGGALGAILVCVGTVQVLLYVVFRGGPLARIGSRARRLLAANAVVIAGGWLAWLALTRAAGLGPDAVGAAAGSVLAAGVVVGMLFEGWLGAPAAGAAAVAIGAALLYAGLQALAHAAHWTRATPEDWTAYAGLNAIGAAVILHVAIGRRWPFSSGQ